VPIFTKYRPALQLSTDYLYTEYHDSRRNGESFILYHERTDRQAHAYCLIIRRCYSLLEECLTRGEARIH